MTRAALALVLVVAVPAGAASAQPVQGGKELYAPACVTCHGPDARGIDGRGPSLHGAGAAAADFYLTTGYMPLREPDRQPERRKPSYSRDEIHALVAYIGSLGGPPIPRVRPERGSLREGLRLFTEHCSGCHQIDGQGGYVSGALAPPLDDATPTQIAEAVRIGPYVMPRFPRAVISDRELDSIVAYVGLAKDPVDRGGWSIGHLGPVSEGLVAWLLAASVLVLLAVVIGDRVRQKE